MKMMKMRGSALFLIGIMVLMLVVIVASLRIDAFKTRILPLIISGAVLALSALRLAMELRSRDKSGGGKGVVEGTEDKSGDAEGAEKGGIRKYAFSLAWIIGFVLSVYVVGFLISMPAYVFAFTKTHGVGWRTSILVSLLTTAICYATFVLALQIELYPGLLLGGY